jgi:hypothetical protein
MFVYYYSLAAWFHHLVFGVTVVAFCCSVALAYEMFRLFIL